MAFRVRYRYRFGDIDRAGIAYYPKLLHLAHCAFEDWWADGLGKTYPRLLDEDNLGFPAVHLDVDFKNMIRYGDDVEVEVVVLRVGNSSVDFGFLMVDPGSSWPESSRSDDPGSTSGGGEVPETEYCRVRKTAVAVDMQTGKKRAIPDKWRAAFEAQVVEREEWEAGG